MSVGRDKLFEEIWAEPMTTVAARYHVSSSFLARVCERLNLPRPPRGYWAQLQFGKAADRPGLPEAQPGDELEWSRDGEPRRRMPRALPKAPERRQRTKARPVGERPEVHELIQGARELFEAGRKSDSGYLRPLKRLLPDLFVSTGTIGSALDLANQLFLALEDRGHQVTLAPRDGQYNRPEVDERQEPGRERHYYQTWNPARPTVTFIGTVAFGLTLFEMSESVEQIYVRNKLVRVSELSEKRRRALQNGYSWTHTSDLPSGRLCIRATSPYPRVSWERKWPEASPGELAGRIPQIIRSLEREAAPIAKLVAEARRQVELEYQKWQEEMERSRREEAEAQRLRAIEEAERRRVRNIKDSRDQLFAIIEAWGVARNMEAFFLDAEQRAAALDESEREAVLDRLRRARSFLGGMDAIKRFREWRDPEER